MNERETLDTIATLIDTARRPRSAPDPVALAAENAEVLDKITALLQVHKIENADRARRDAVINAVAVLREAGNDLFRSGQATAARYAWKAEDRLRATFGLKSPGDATAMPDLEKKE